MNQNDRQSNGQRPTAARTTQQNHTHVSRDTKRENTNWGDEAERTLTTTHDKTLANKTAVLMHLCAHNMVETWPTTPLLCTSARESSVPRPTPRRGTTTTPDTSKPPWISEQTRYHTHRAHQPVPLGWRKRFVWRVATFKNIETPHI